MSSPATPTTRKRARQAAAAPLNKHTRSVSATSVARTTPAAFSSSSFPYPTTAVATSSSLASASAADWAGLPAALFVAVGCFLSDYRCLLPPSASECAVPGLMWRDHPLVGVLVEEGRCVVVHGETELPPHQGKWTSRWLSALLSELFATLRHLPACALTLRPNRAFAGSNGMRVCVKKGTLRAGLKPLPVFDRLTSLIVRVEPDHIFPQSSHVLVAALTALRRLKCLELHWGTGWRGKYKLRKLLHRLCCEQLEHVGVSDEWLQGLSWRDKAGKLPMAPMPAVRSFRYLGLWGPAAVTSLAVFPSLTHADLNISDYLRRHIDLRSLQPLSSLRLHLSCFRHQPVMDLPQLHTLVVWLNLNEPSQQRDLRDLLAGTPALRHFAIAASRTELEDRAEPPLAADLITTLLEPFAALTYLQLDASLWPDDWQRLLTHALPPVFAASLTHLALRCHPDHRHDAARLLANLPSLYPALKRCHVGESESLSSIRRDESEDDGWDAAVQALKQALGAVWCECEADVVAGRADMVWRREASVQYDDGMGAAGK